MENPYLNSTILIDMLYSGITGRCDINTTVTTDPQRHPARISNTVVTRALQ